MDGKETATNKKIVQLYNDMEQKVLILSPSFQRNLVWNNTHKEKFIETILKGLPFPEVYFASGQIDLKRMTSETLVVDGQQRLGTIYEYIKNDNNLILKKIPRFDSLDDDEKTSFLDYNVVVRDLGRISLDDIKDIFSRINSVQYALNAVEINNALYEGSFITTAKEILATNLLSEFEVFADSEISRMKDLGFILLVMSTIEVGGYFSRDNEIEATIKEFDEHYPNKNTIYETITGTLNYIRQLNLPSDSLWLKKTGLFTLVIELIKFTSDKNNFPEITKGYNCLSNLEKNIFLNKDSTENEYGNFYKYVFQSTTSRQGRIIRGELLRKALNENY